MSDTVSQAKVLKIGIVVEDKLVEERVVATKAPVTLGRSTSATFTIAEADLDEHLLFTWREDRYHLRFTAGMKGQFTLQGEKASTAKLAKAEGTPKDGDAFIVGLDEEDKGFVNVGPAKVLFRFVEAPVQAVVPPVETPIDFRPRMLQDDDPVFLGMLGLMSALALVFGLWVMNTEPRKLTIAEIAPRARQVAKILREAPKNSAEAKVESKKPEEKKPEAKKTEEVAKAKADPTPAPRRDIAETRRQIEQTSALFQMVQSRVLAGRGDASRGTVILGQDQGGVSNLSDMIAQAGKTGVTDASGLRTGPGGVGTGQRGIGEIQGGVDGGTNLQVAAAPKIVKPTVADGEIEGSASTLTDAKKVIKSQRGQLLSCHETALKTNPKVAGKVVVEWTVAAGAATDVHIVDNTTDDDGLAACVAGKIRKWKFGETPDGDVTQAFIFQPKEE